MSLLSETRVLDLLQLRLQELWAAGYGAGNWIWAFCEIVSALRCQVISPARNANFFTYLCVPMCRCVHVNAAPKLSVVFFFFYRFLSLRDLISHNFYPYMLMTTFTLKKENLNFFLTFEFLYLCVCQLWVLHVWRTCVWMAIGSPRVRAVRCGCELPDVGAAKWVLIL